MNRTDGPSVDRAIHRRSARAVELDKMNVNTT